MYVVQSYQVVSVLCGVNSDLKRWWWGGGGPTSSFRWSCSKLLKVNSQLRNDPVQNIHIVSSCVASF